MKKISLLITFVLILALTGCENTSSQISSDAASSLISNNSTESTLENVTLDRRNGIPCLEMYWGHPVVFDFAEIPAEIKLKGEFTVNQLIEKYGTPTKIFGSLSDYESSIWVTLDFGEVYIELINYYDSTNWSFDTKSNWDELDSTDDTIKEYPITNKDKTIPINIYSVKFKDPNLQLPRELKIGASTRSEVLSAYPKVSSELSSDVDYIEYAYSFLEPGMKVYNDIHDNDIHIITYGFSDKNILTEITINWH